MSSGEAMRIWKLESGETDWVAAKSAVHAVLVYMKATGITADELIDDDIDVEEVRYEDAFSTFVRSDDGTPAKTLWKVFEENMFEARVLCSTCF